MSCGILVPRPGVEPMSSALEGRFLFIGCARSSLLCGLFLVAASRVYSLVVVRGLLFAVAYLVVEHRV